ncbi:hypothetical protein JD844_024248, partial [Phrynosoma platyrhinos]
MISRQAFCISTTRLEPGGNQDDQTGPAGGQVPILQPPPNPDAPPPGF